MAGPHEVLSKSRSSNTNKWRPNLSCSFFGVCSGDYKEASLEDFSQSAATSYSDPFADDSVGDDDYTIDTRGIKDFINMSFSSGATTRSSRRRTTMSKMQKHESLKLKTQ